MRMVIVKEEFYPWYKIEAVEPQDTWKYIHNFDGLFIRRYNKITRAFIKLQNDLHEIVEEWDKTHEAIP